MQSKAASVEEYLAELPADRRHAISAVRQAILKNLDKDYEEGMSYGMIGYYVPHRVYPAGYHCNPQQPLPFVCLASQKNYMSLYMMSVYDDKADGKWFHEAWSKTGKKLDMGKCCLRFKKLEDLPLDLVGEAIRRMPVRRFVPYYEGVLKNMRSARGKKGSAANVGKTAAGSKPKSLTAKKKGTVAKKTAVRSRKK